MAHYAFISNGNVVRVITGRDETDTDLLPDNVNSWEEYYSINANLECKRTSYNTIGNQHLTGGTPFRGNFARKGGTYDSVNDVFINPKPFDSWILNETNWLWEAPVPLPELTQEETDAGSYYVWNEHKLTWELITN